MKLLEQSCKIRERDVSMDCFNCHVGGKTMKEGYFDSCPLVSLLHGPPPKQLHKKDRKKIIIVYIFCDITC